MGTLPFALDAETRAADASDHRAELRLWLRLFTCTNMIEAAIRTRLRDEFRVTLPRFDLMAQLERLPHGETGMNLGELSRRMMVSNGNVTGLVERLVAEGLLLRCIDETDRRVVLVALTPAGRQEFARMARVHADWIGDLFGGLSAQDISSLMRLLARVKKSVAGAA
jgi:DNA-binding MarR family transcriptional regulator